MAPSCKSSLLWLLSISVTYTLIGGSLGSSNEDRKTYIVYMGDPLKDGLSSASLHASILQEVGSASDCLVHSYYRSFNGFVAKLTTEEKEKLAAMDGVVSVFPNQKKQLLTTRSWDFLGFPQNVLRSTTESDIIVGMLDSGIWPESPSFNDQGFGPPPSKWKGTCQRANFTCNNKIIGAKYYHSEREMYPEDLPSPRDTNGHGSHTSSIVAGGIVEGASLLGLGEGTARGGMPSARIAVYKICWFDGCGDVDILAAFDDAIADGVDIISLSVGGQPTDYFTDSIAIGAYHAMKNGVLTSQSAGNDGPYPSSLSSCAPWLLSVAASTIDRKFVTQVKLGNGATFEGISINTFELGTSYYPLIYGGNAPNATANQTTNPSRYCEAGSLDENLVKGKIVVCDELGSGDGPSGVGAFGAIMQDSYFVGDFAISFPLSTSLLNQTNSATVMQYLNSTRNPTATILRSIEQNETSAPFVVSFSSRGPNQITSDILKPDLTAPGVDILAAWSEATTVTGYPKDNRVVKFNIVSGTSMSCPHASAAAAYVKSFHPNWSPAAIKSALMTTASQMTTKVDKDAEFAYGSGHLNPVKAKDPGLVYDLQENDYLKFLCGEGYTSKQLQLITGQNLTCNKIGNETVWDLNYPSFALSGKPGQYITRAFHRTVTNVGSTSASYKGLVNATPGLNIEVYPQSLYFENVGDTVAFVVNVTAKLGINDTAKLGINGTLSGSLVWDDGQHTVRSPVVAFVLPPQD